MKYAVAINDQGRSSPTIVLDFVYQQNENVHVWKGKFATNMRELAYQVNEASEHLRNLGMDTAFVTLRVVEIEAEESVDSRIRSLEQANAELRAIISGKPDRSAA